MNFVLETMFYTYPVHNHNLCIIFVRVYVAYPSKLLRSERKMLKELAYFELGKDAVASLQRKDLPKLPYLQTILVSFQVLF